MVKRRKHNSSKKRNGKGFKENGTQARIINASTVYETCTEQLSPFGGLLALIKFLDLSRFKEIFDSIYLAPRREPKLGHHLMVVGVLMLLFIGFNRLWHFTYIRLDAMIARIRIGENHCADVNHHDAGLQGIVNNTIRIARLKLLFIAAKIVKESNVDKVKYSIYDARIPVIS